MYTMIDGQPVNLGYAYGYCFVPQVYGEQAVMALSPAGNLVDWKLHPYCETKQEAIDWLESRGLKGEILRYAHHEPPELRAGDYRPWVTAGVVAKVEGEYLEAKSPHYVEAVEWAREMGRRLRADA